MVRIYMFFVLFIFVLSLNSCTVEPFINDPLYINNNTPNPLEEYDLWYVDYDATTGTGNIPFLSRAFTLSLVQGKVYANNNLATIGITGNGLGNGVGSYIYFQNQLQVSHQIYGSITLEVIPRNQNRIELYSKKYNVSYFLTGYQRNTFNYDLVFNNHIQYFLQEYKVWEKVAVSYYGKENVFDKENYLQFIPEGNGNTFRSSIDRNGIGINYLHWDYTGKYSITHRYQTNDKILTLDYDFLNNEIFIISVINNHRIKLIHKASGTVYEFEGRAFIEYYRKQG